MMQVHKTVSLSSLMLMLLLLMTGCFGGHVPVANDDAGYLPAPDLSPLCSGNNDGVIERGELVFPVGVTASYLFNPAGTNVAVSPDGTLGVDGPEWDLTSTAGEVHQLTLLPVDQQWFAADFPTATYALVTDIASGTLGVFQVTGDALLLLGFVSPTADASTQTLLKYDQAVALVRFPLQKGQGWVTGARIANGKLNGQPFASTDTYRISVDARGVAVLPFLRFTNTLRLRVELTQTLPAGVAVRHTQLLFFHECYGELGRMVSNPNDPNPSFTQAAELRRLAL